MYRLIVPVGIWSVPWRYVSLLKVLLDKLNGDSIIDFTSISDEQYSKANSSILVTLLGIVTVVRPVQSMKAQFPMLVTLLGIVTEIRPVHFPKAPPPILITLLGIVTEVRPLHPQNVLCVDNQQFTC